MTTRMTGQTSLCPTCGLLFTSTSAFDQHRRGSYDISAPHYGRKCLDEAALRAKGMAPDEKNRWRVPAPAGRAWRGEVPHENEE